MMAQSSATSSTAGHKATVNTLAYPFSWLGLMEHRAECSCGFRAHWHIDRRQAERESWEHVQ
jgi:hypothetical protein